MDGNSVSEGVIYEKALRIYADIVKETPSSSAEGESGFSFEASRNRFETFNHRSGIYCIVRHGEAASSNKDAAEEYDGEFRDVANA